MQDILSLHDIDIQGKRLLIREDFNVPLRQGRITDTARIDRALPTINHALTHGAAVILCSHLGRPTEGEPHPDYSLRVVADCLSEKLNHPVRLAEQWLDGISANPGEVVLCENVRFHQGETANDTELAKRMANLCDVFVMDAFATAHRAQASTTGVAIQAKQACAGPLLTAELNALHTALASPARPLIAVVGGAKVSTKIQLLDSLLEQVDVLIPGGGIANTFLKAQGVDIGQSLHEPDFIPLAKELLHRAERHNTQLFLPQDVRVATQFNEEATATSRTLDTIQSDELILDVGPATEALYAGIMSQAGTIVWNGPVGVFEFPEFAAGTAALGQAIADSAAYSIAGGGDTLAALSRFQLMDRIDYVSTGGGAFLSYLQGETLPAVAALNRK